MEGLMRRITASAGNASYEILIGSSILPESLRREELNRHESIAVIASSRVYNLHRDYIDESLDSMRDRCHLLLFDDREENKSYAMAGQFLEKFLKLKLSRRSAVIGIGGGVTGDFAGYCAAVYMRGIPVAHVPTTLLAMVDSSIGGKTAVNLSVGKNIAGVFRQPSLVISDMMFLRTLPDRELRNGLSEALKHALIGEKSTLALLEGNDFGSIQREDRLSELVALSAAFKSSIVERDELENDMRAILNFGHTIGHAIESFTGYQGISHGEAVAAGIRVKAEVSRRMGLLSGAETDRINAVIDAYGLMLKKWDIDIDGVIDHMMYDKKNFGGAINFVLLKGVGKPNINQHIPPDLLLKVMKEILC
jgi:3-dehydroquinate synthase